MPVEAKTEGYYSRQVCSLKPIKQGGAVRIHLPGQTTLTHVVYKTTEIQVYRTCYRSPNTSMKQLAGPDLPLSTSTQEDGEISDTHSIETQT